MTHATAHEIGLPRGVRGAADPHFACAIRSFANLFPGRRFGGGALAVYLDGRPVVDVWTGWSDRDGEVPWDADTGAMVFSATKGMASTVIHRLADRGLLDYDAPVAKYWPEFGVNGKAGITVRDAMRHRAGLSHLNGVRKEELLDHRLMEERIATAPASRLVGIPAYHALTYGWLMSGLARAVTGRGMRDLIRTEVAQPLNTDGLHLGRPPAHTSTKAAQILAPQSTKANALFNFVAPKIAALWFSSGFGAMYFPGMKAVVQGEIPFLDSEAPAANGVATARGLAKMYGAIANGGRIDGMRFLSTDLVRNMTGKPSFRPDFNIMVPLSWHLGYHAVPFPGVMPGFGHAGLGGSIGWADPASGMSFGFVHNRLLTPMLLDQVSFVGVAALLRRGAQAARRRGPQTVPEFGAPYPEPPGVAAG
ncbi:serine hydrolase domain-containing protein [Mycobacterium sp.]|uniref:esterase/beta-lactamase LipL n=1 Tax=Mycobacterium sp. TaxID=1785 RepID=UPI002D0348D1|nr:serine hydrolase domain-containing protein [Mycobacterium sp.]HME49964.1 serine hydrolase domain-containing protein [Mycobacterium sp.]